MIACIYRYDINKISWLVKMMLVVSLSLLWSLVEVHSQTEYPYVSFMGENLPNHSYVDLTLVGGSKYYLWSLHLLIDNALHCVTDLDGCCSNDYGPYHGDWYFPDEEIVQPYDQLAESISVSTTHGNQTIYLHRIKHTLAPSGIYHCEVAVYDDYYEAVNKTVYVGLYYYDYEG